jgi:hypothetical protein
MADSDINVQSCAIIGLIERSVDGVTDKLSTLHYPVQKNVVSFLEDWNDPHAIPLLQAFLTDYCFQLVAALSLIKRGVADLTCYEILLKKQAIHGGANSIALQAMLTQPDSKRCNRILAAPWVGPEFDVLFTTLLSKLDGYALGTLNAFCRDPDVIATLRSALNDMCALWHEGGGVTFKLGAEGEQKEQTIGNQISQIGLLLWLHGGTPVLHSAVRDWLVSDPKPPDHRASLQYWKSETMLVWQWLPKRLPSGYDQPGDDQQATYVERALFFLAAHNR